MARTPGHWPWPADLPRRAGAAAANRRGYAPKPTLTPSGGAREIGRHEGDGPGGASRLPLSGRRATTLSGIMQPTLGQQPVQGLNSGKEKQTCNGAKCSRGKGAMERSRLRRAHRHMSVAPPSRQSHDRWEKRRRSLICHPYLSAGQDPARGHGPSGRATAVLEPLPCPCRRPFAGDTHEPSAPHHRCYTSQDRDNRGLRGLFPRS